MGAAADRVRSRRRDLADRISSALSRRARCPALGAYQFRSLEIFGAPDIGTFEYEQARAEQDALSIWMMHRPLTCVKLLASPRRPGNEHIAGKRFRAS